VVDAERLVVCHVPLHLAEDKKRSTIHIDYYDDDILVAEGLAIAPEDIDPLIEALQAVKRQI
jgi:hypothetical protein